MSNFIIIPVSAEDDIINEINIICEILNTSTLHLRKKSYLKTFNILSKIPKKLRKNLVVHSYLSLVVFFNCGGVHLKSSQNQNILNQIICKLLKALNFKISTSIHDKNELINCLKLNLFNYYFVGAIFDSNSKKGYKSCFSQEDIHELIQISGNLVGIGGIDSNNILRLKSWGFYGGAMIGSIWDSENPIEKLKAINEICN